MKKYTSISFVLALGIALSSASLASAQAMPAPKIPPEKIVHVRTDMNVLTGKLNSTLAGQGDVGGRLESRIKKIGDAGHNTSDLQKKIAAAHASWNIAKKDFDALGKTADATLQKDKAKTAYLTIQAAVQKIQNDLQATQEKLTEILALVKALPQAPEMTASTTTSPSTNQ